MLDIREIFFQSGPQVPEMSHLERLKLLKLTSANHLVYGRISEAGEWLIHWFSHVIPT
ncbi:hypothetical protein D3C76_809140 [compost metagenome]